MLVAEVLLDTPRPADELVTLPFEVRQKSRFRTTLDSGRELLVRLPHGTQLRHGALLGASDGVVIEVRAAAETLSVVECSDPHLLSRAAYHLGNRHIPLQIDPGRLSYQHDHVLDDMLRKLGLTPTVEQRPFEPEAGAYGAHGSVHAH